MEHSAATRVNPSPLSRLASLARARGPESRCELCAASIHEAHSHLLEIETRQLLCACEACAILFSSEHGERFRRVPRRASALPDLILAEPIWQSLHVPINLAFFYHDSAKGRVVAMYPSPAGATESVLPVDAWADLAATSPALREMASDVEALLVNYVGRRRDCFIVSIDECYRLVGLIRTNWRGLSGGSEVWKKIEAMFDRLYRIAGSPVPAREATHA